MGRQTDIGWARSTRNFWSGCTKISTRASGGGGCDGCYAEAASRFFAGKDQATGQAKNWGAGAPRTPTLEGAARDLRKWNDICATERAHGHVFGKDIGYWDKPGFWPVFINNFSDVLDNEVPDEWRDFMWPVLEECTNLDIYLVTKRIGNAPAMFPPAWLDHGFPSHIRLLITVVNQMEADRDVPKLLRLPCKNGISYEPALGPVDWAPFLDRGTEHMGHHEFRRVEWIILGGASKQADYDPPAFDVEWAYTTIAQGRATGVPVFLKQLGTHPVFEKTVQRSLVMRHPACADPAEWPVDLRVQEFPDRSRAAA